MASNSQLNPTNPLTAMLNSQQSDDLMQLQQRMQQGGSSLSAQEVEQAEALLFLGSAHNELTQDPTKNNPQYLSNLLQKVLQTVQPNQGVNVLQEDTVVGDAIVDIKSGATVQEGKYQGKVLMKPIDPAFGPNSPLPANEGGPTSPNAPSTLYTMLDDYEEANIFDQQIEQYWADPTGQDNPQCDWGFGEDD